MTHDRKSESPRKHLHTILPAAVVAIAASLPAESRAQPDLFLKFDGTDIKGSSDVEEYKDQLVILSWSWGVQNSTLLQAIGNGGPSNVQSQFSSVLFSKNPDEASKEIYENLALGTSFKSVVLTTAQAEPFPEGIRYIRNLELTLENATIDSASTSASSGSDGGIPIETFSLVPAKVTMKFFKKDEDSGEEVPVKGDFCWDIANSKQC